MGPWKVLRAHLNLAMLARLPAIVSKLHLLQQVPELDQSSAETVECCGSDGDNVVNLYEPDYLLILYEDGISSP